jgi:hypothetical protein
MQSTNVMSGFVTRGGGRSSGHKLRIRSDLRHAEAAISTKRLRSNRLAALLGALICLIGRQLYAGWFRLPPRWTAHSICLHLR